jgi:bacteriocin biosynthesis cyclodehydratase domain-containing protein
MIRTPLLRPILLPGLTPVWRGTHTLQLGLDPARAVVIDLPDPRLAQLLDLLDGSRPERVVLAHAHRLGLSADDVRALLDILYAAGLVVGAHTLLPSALPPETLQRLTNEATTLALEAVAGPRRPADAATPAQLLRRRAAARVVVAGRGRLAAALAVALAESGVGHVDADLPGLVTRQELPGGPLGAADVGLSRAVAVAAAIRRAAPGTETRTVRRGTASLVLQCGHEQPVVLLAAGHARRRQAHLAVSIREGAAVVGPLVTPTGAPCLNCLDLHRRDRDSDWPALAAQLGGTGPEPCSAATALAATGYAVAEALTYLDGGIPQTVGAAVQISAAGRFRRRTWPPHPACRCGRRRPTPGRPTPGSTPGASPPSM